MQWKDTIKLYDQDPDCKKDPKMENILGQPRIMRFFSCYVQLWINIKFYLNRQIQI